MKKSYRRYHLRLTVRRPWRVERKFVAGPELRWILVHGVAENAHFDSSSSERYELVWNSWFRMGTGWSRSADWYVVILVVACVGFCLNWE